jgi:hypothetical protein
LVCRDFLADLACGFRGIRCASRTSSHAAFSNLRRPYPNTTMDGRAANAGARAQTLWGETDGGYGAIWAAMSRLLMCPSRQFLLCSASHRSVCCN